MYEDSATGSGSQEATVPNVARMYDYYLDGKENFAVDRLAADRLLAVFPQLRDLAKQNRAFLGRVVRYLAEDGIRQFLDIGTGLPTQENVHQVAQRVAPDVSVVYVDRDPVVLAHGRALLANQPRTIVVQADLENPDALLANPQLQALLDFDQPVAVLLVAIVHFVEDDDEASRIVARLRSQLCPGSALAISHAYLGHIDDAKLNIQEQARRAYSGATQYPKARSYEQILSYFDGLTLVEPGLVPAQSWRTDVASDLAAASFLGGVGRK